MKLSASGMLKFLSCQRKYYYEDILGWELAKKRPWLIVGTKYDKLLEYYDMLGFEASLEKVEELWEDPYEQIQAYYLLHQYHDVCYDTPKAINKGNQFGFGFPYPGNEIIGRVDGLTVTGYMDKLASGKDGELIVVERKTTSDAIEPNSEYWDRLLMNTQIIAYVWYLYQMGEKAGRVRYEVLRKISPKISPKLDPKKLSPKEYGDLLFSTDWKKTFVAYKEVTISEQQIAEFGIEISFTYQDIIKNLERTQAIESQGFEGDYGWRKNEKSCKDYGGCPHLSVCLGVDTHQSSGIFIKSDKWIKGVVNKK